MEVEPQQMIHAGPHLVPTISYLYIYVGNQAHPAHLLGSEECSLLQEKSDEEGAKCTSGLLAGVDGILNKGLRFPCGVWDSKPAWNGGDRVEC